MLGIGQRHFHPKVSHSDRNYESNKFPKMYCDFIMKMCHMLRINGQLKRYSVEIYLIIPYTT